MQRHWHKLPRFSNAKRLCRRQFYGLIACTAWRKPINQLNAVISFICGLSMDLVQGEFRVASEADADALSKRLADYLRAHSIEPILPFRIVDAYRSFSKDKEVGRLNAAFLDVLLMYAHMRVDALTFCGIWNDKFSKGALEGGNVLACAERFIHKAEIHRSAVAFVFRYRALWDKIMGLLVLRFVPGEYNAYTRGKSRLNKFKAIAQPVEAFSTDFIETSHALARAFDDSYRTHEAHGTGVLRKFVYNMQTTEEDNPLIAFAAFWNELQLVLIKVDALIVDGPRAPKAKLKPPKPLQSETDEGRRDESE